MSHDTKDKPTDENVLPAYEEDDSLDVTMMDIDLKKIQTNQVPQKKLEPKTKNEEESVEELLKKKKSLSNRIKGLFGIK